MRRDRAVVSAAVLLLTIFILLTLFAVFANRVAQETPDISPGYADLTTFDCGEKLASLPNKGFLYYRQALYTPEDFALGRVQTEPVVLGEGRVDPGSYGTYRTVIKLPAGGETYGLSASSAMYAQRLFIDGREYPAVGVVGSTAETSTPMSQRYTVFFTPQSESVEIVVQFANFVHADYGGITPLLFGSQQLIIQRDAVAQQRVHVFVGCTLTIFLFFLGLFLFFPRRYSFLWFALAHLATAVRILIVREKAIMLLFPSLPWRWSIGLEYLSLIVLFLAFLLYLHNVFKGALHRYVIYAYTAVCALYAMTILTAPTLFYTRFILPFQLCTAAFGLYLLAAIIYNISTKKDNRHLEHFLILAGALIFIVLAIIDIQIQRSGGHSLTLGLAVSGMVVLSITGMIALVLEFSRTEAELDSARRHELEMRERNQLLDRMSQLKSDFLANISHEMRTPLTVMSSYAGLTSLEIRRGAVNDRTLEHLDVVKREAIRLAAMVEQMKSVSFEKSRELARANTNAVVLLRQATDFCRPICLKNNNSLSVTGDSELSLHVEPNGVFQVLINLIINADRHTKNGTIRLAVSAASNRGFATVSVTDDGEGVAPERLPGLFARGASGDGSSGLGLAICKEIVEEHGGDIQIISELGKGTQVLITLPMSEGGQTLHGDSIDH